MSSIRIIQSIGLLKGLYFYLPIFALYMTGHGVSFAAIVIGQAVYSLAKLVGEVPTGVFADKYGQRISMILGYVLEAVGLVALILSPTVAHRFWHECELRTWRNRSRLFKWQRRGDAI
ncbi:MAG: MFS transporter [Patescibacteria group bacterium]